MGITSQDSRFKIQALRIPCTEQMFPPHSQIQTARSVHLFISRFVCYDRVDSSEDPVYSLFLVVVCYDRVDSSEDPVYGADVSATLTDPDCKVSSSLYFSLFATTGWTALRIPCTERMFPPHSQIQTARSVPGFFGSGSALIWAAGSGSGSKCTKIVDFF